MTRQSTTVHLTLLATMLLTLGACAGPRSPSTPKPKDPGAAGPRRAKTLVIGVYEHAFRFFDLSYGSTLGVAGLGVTLAVAAAYFAAQRRLGYGGI